MYQQLVEAGTLVPQPDKPVPPLPMDLAAAVKAGLVRAPTNVVSTICDDRGARPGRVDGAWMEHEWSMGSWGMGVWGWGHRWRMEAGGEGQR